MFTYKGAIVALVTPMEDDGNISWEALYSLIDWQISSGISGIVVVGTTGESSTIDVSEHIQIIERCVEHIDKRVPLIAGTGANSTKEAIYLTNAAKEAGADSVLLVTPYYNKPTQEGLYMHYSSIADKVDINQILYNVTTRTACDILPSTVARLASHENIIGLKEASSDLLRLDLLIENLEQASIKDFLLFSGDDMTSCDFLKKGGHGTISVTANLVPDLIVDLCDASISRKNNDKSKRIHQSLISLNKALFVESNPIPIKRALSILGKIPSGIRLPLTQLDVKLEPELLLAMKELGLIK